MNELWIALIGFLGAIFGSLISGFIEIYITQKTLRNSQKEFNSNIMQMRRKELNEAAERAEQERRKALKKAEQLFRRENDRFYDLLVEEMSVYDRLRNELHYLNNLTHPNRRTKAPFIGIYPHIDDKVSQIVGNVQLPQDIAALLGALRSNISYYNAALDKDFSSEIMEELLNNIYKVIGPINDELFTNYANAQTALRKHDIERGQQEIETESVKPIK